MVELFQTGPSISVARDSVCEAVRLAAQAHGGQIDKSGQPYILHPLRVGLAGKTPAEQIVGFLHDVLEDTDMHLGVLSRAFSSPIIMALDAITRCPGETYRAYIERVSRNHIAKAVKINDLRDNMARLGNLPQNEADGLRRRYEKALYILLEDDSNG